MAQAYLETRNPLGKGEVLSSILSGSTRYAHELRASRTPVPGYPATRYGTAREHDVSIRGKSVDSDRRLFTPPTLTSNRRRPVDIIGVPSVIEQATRRVGKHREARMYSADGEKVCVEQDGEKQLFLTVHPTDTGQTMTVEEQAKVLAEMLNDL